MVQKSVIFKVKTLIYSVVFKTKQNFRKLLGSVPVVSQNLKYVVEIQNWCYTVQLLSSVNHKTIYNKLLALWIFVVRTFVPVLAHFTYNYLIEFSKSFALSAYLPFYIDRDI